MEADEGNILEHTTSMASRPPNAQREIKLIHASLNNPYSILSQLIEWPAIDACPINEYATLELLDMGMCRIMVNQTMALSGSAKSTN